jgi:hypothetical protein
MFPPFVGFLGLCVGRINRWKSRRLRGAPTLARSNYVQEILINSKTSVALWLCSA